MGQAARLRRACLLCCLQAAQLVELLDLMVVLQREALAKLVLHAQVRAGGVACLVAPAGEAVLRCARV